jgi:hypothetical protein
MTWISFKFRSIGINGVGGNGFLCILDFVDCGFLEMGISGGKILVVHVSWVNLYKGMVRYLRFDQCMRMKNRGFGNPSSYYYGNWDLHRRLAAFTASDKSFLILTPINVTPNRNQN